MRGTSRFIRILVVLAVAVAWTLSLNPLSASADNTWTPKPAKSAQQVYTQTGAWTYGGRSWSTDCKKYSSTVTRCTTNIWGTQISYAAGKFNVKNGWTFNNLTYLTSPRSDWDRYDANGAWNPNPLVTPGEHTISGRKWRTQCDTSWTGGNGCRSEILSTKAVYKDGKYQNATLWVFNNIVNVTAIPCDVKQQRVRDLIADQSVVIEFCLKSRVDPNWLAVQYAVTDKDKQMYLETAFFNKKADGWGFGGKGGLHASSVCDFYEKAGVPHDLADTVSYCFPNG